MPLQKSKQVLITTLPPQIIGGVAIKTRILADYLRSRGHKVTIAHYATFTHGSNLNVSLKNIAKKWKPTVSRYKAFGDHDCIAIGCLFPELEATYTQSSKRWHQIIRENDRHIAVSGTIVPATPFVKLGLPHLIWCASDVIGDRIDRRSSMGFLRKLYDNYIVTPLLCKQEKAILKGTGYICGVSPFTIKSLTNQTSSDSERFSEMPIPVDTSKFFPESGFKRGRIGFVGRLNDPRKNINLLFDVAEILKFNETNFELYLAGIGGEYFKEQVQIRGLENNIKFVGQLSEKKLLDFYQSLDLFVIPSHQEGLAIVGLEAMATGLPIVSTRCGGPEAYVRDQKNGFLVDPDEKEMATAIKTILINRETRDRMSQKSLEIVQTEYSHNAFSKILQNKWREIWNEEI